MRFAQYVGDSRSFASASAVSVPGAIDAAEHAKALAEPLRDGVVLAPVSAMLAPP